MNRITAPLTITALLATILVANYVTTEYGMIPVGFGLTATAGTYLAGAAFILRDTVQDTAGKLAVLGTLAAGAVLSYIVSAPMIATASAVAFLVSELADFAVYTPLRKRGYVRAAVASNITGAVLDTLLFLWIAGFGLAAPIVTGQIVGKLTVTAVVAVGYLAYKSRNRVQTA